MTNSKTAIFLSGPIGSGKSTMGAALAHALNGIFVEGDEHSAPGKPWYASSLSTARSIVGSIVKSATDGRPVVIAYPLRCIDWVYYRRCLEGHAIQTVVVSLSASYNSITNPRRGRHFSEAERSRIRQMIAEGYGRRQFGDFALSTDHESREAVLSRLLSEFSGIGIR